MKTLLLVFLLLAATARALSAQEGDHLWMPDGYRLLSEEDRRTLPPEEVKAIQTRNTALLREAIHAMTPEERQAVAQRLSAFGQAHRLAPLEGQYVSLTTMMLLSAALEPEAQREKQLKKERLEAQAREEEKLAAEQEESSQGFLSAPGSVEAEARAVEELLGKEAASKLYLRILRPLRAQPSNEPARVVFRKVIRGNPALIGAALTFVHSRETETPTEGAWYSLEAFVRLSMLDQVAEAKKLFAIAISKKAWDTESLIFPLLLAEIEEDGNEIAWLLPRAQRAWPRQEDLGRVFFDSIEVLPTLLQVKALQTFEAKYKRAHPSDWASRARVLWNKLEVEPDGLEDSHLRPVEEEATAVLGLPPAALPEPHRTEFFAIELIAKARRGRCAEVEPQLGRLDSESVIAYPRDLEAEGPPRPRTAAEVRLLRASITEDQKLQAELESFLRTGPSGGLSELEGVPAKERRQQAQAMLSELKRSSAETLEMLRSADDVTVAGDWSRRELVNWEKENGLENRFYDRASHAQRLSIQVRTATGRCLVARRLFDRAANVVKPCLGQGRNLHFDCIHVLGDAGRELVRAKRIREAESIYRALPEGADDFRTPTLFELIEEAAPGTLKKPDGVPKIPPPHAGP